MWGNELKAILDWSEEAKESVVQWECLAHGWWFSLLQMLRLVLLKRLKC